MDRELKVNYTGIIITALALLDVIIHLVFSYNLEYHRDELLYFSLGQHPAFGYATVPPMIGWVAWIMQHVFGNSLFAPVSDCGRGSIVGKCAQKNMDEGINDYAPDNSHSSDTADWDSCL